MLGFNDLVSAAAQADATFYSDRGVALHTLEVTSYSCKDPTQAVILQEIIRETTNRINALQKQRSENEVLSEKLATDLALEVAKKNLVQAQAENDRVLARSEGEAQGLRYATSLGTFLAEINSTVA